MPTVLFCDACGKQNREEAKFCGHCGKSLHTTVQKKKPASMAKVLLIPLVTLGVGILIGIEIGKRTNKIDTTSASLHETKTDGEESTSPSASSIDLTVYNKAKELIESNLFNTSDIF